MGRFKGNLRSSEEGADTIVWLSLHASVAKESGRFYFDREAVSPHLTLGGTHSSKEDVDKMYATLRKLAGMDKV